MSQATRESMQAVSQAVYLDHAVDEVLRLMLGIAVVPMDFVPSQVGESLTAVVGLAGALSGACMLRMKQKTALRMAEGMIGMEMPELDDTVKDAMGEVGNMIAGAWKGMIPELAARCMLAVPAVVTGTNYQLHVQKPDCRVDRCYKFGEHAFTVSIICDGV